MFFANLHLHSTYSDAGFTPLQLVRIAKALGHSALALTDHETDAGCAELMRAAKREGMESVVGAEFYGMVSDQRLVHLTALDFDSDCPTLRAFIRNRVAVYSEYTKFCFDRGVRLGYIQDITWDDVVTFAGEGNWICYDTVVRAFRLKHLPVPENFRENVFKGDEVKAARPPHPSACEVIEAVRSAGGVVGIAHPQNRIAYVEELVGYGMNGIEVSHPDITEDTAKAAALAAETFGLYRLGGTDHTGPLSANGGKYAVFADNGISEEDYFCMKERRLG